jgi:hypothetical protein
MNKPVWRARILSFGAITETLNGLGLLAQPSAVATFLLGSPLGGTGVVIGQIAGGGLLSIGIACWCARTTPTAPASLGVSWGFLAYNIVACLALACGAPELASGGFPAWGASVLHGMVAVVLLMALFECGRTSVES